jgi:capsular polysaccharide biosynthesis protein
LNFLIRWSWLFVLGVLAAAIPAALLASDTQTTYKSTATLFVTNDPEASERLTNSYAELVKTRPTLNAIRQRLSLNETDEQLKARLSVATNFNSQIVRVSAAYPDAALAAAVANTAANATVESIDLYVGKAGTIKVVEAAEADLTPSKQPVLTRAILAGGLGFLVALSIAIGVESLRSNRQPSPAREREHRLDRDPHPETG